jgi:mannose/cellobiose epimerase-like protein (N-acyl-D-glucosamine 2-epimerase family)
MGDPIQRKTTDPLAIADEMERVLTKGMMDFWYPQCIDEECGGFLSSFDKDWKPLERRFSIYPSKRSKQFNSYS